MVTELSRLSRSIKDFSHMWELMRLHGCGFLSLRVQDESIKGRQSEPVLSDRAIRALNKRNTSPTCQKDEVAASAGTAKPMCDMAMFAVEDFAKLLGVILLGVIGLRFLARELLRLFYFEVVRSVWARWDVITGEDQLLMAKAIAGCNLQHYFESGQRNVEFDDGKMNQSQAEFFRSFESRERPDGVFIAWLKRDQESRKSIGDWSSPYSLRLEFDYAFENRYRFAEFYLENKGFLQPKLANAPLAVGSIVTANKKR